MCLLLVPGLLAEMPASSLLMCPPKVRPCGRMLRCQWLCSGQRCAVAEDAERCQMAGHTLDWAAGGTLAAFPGERMWLSCCHPPQFGQETPSASAVGGISCRNSSFPLLPKRGNFSSSRRARKAEQSHSKVKRQKMNLKYRGSRTLSQFSESGCPGLCSPSTWIQHM